VRYSPPSILYLKVEEFIGFVFGGAAPGLRGNIFPLKYRFLKERMPKEDGEK